MSKKYDFEYIVIGSGPAGSTAALTLAKTKKRVGLVEGRFFGGTNINTRDIPYDIALNFSRLYDELLSAPEFSHQDFSFNFSSNVAHQQEVVFNYSHLNQKAYETAGIVCIQGFANFLDPHTIAVGKQKITSRYFIIATGSHLKTSEITGVDSVRCLTPETAIKVRRRPQAVLIVGGGSTGCEIATYFAELGAKVFIMETAERLLPREDKEVGITIANHLSRKLGVMVLPSSKVVAVEQDEISKRAIFQNARTEKMIRVDSIVLATGSAPNLDIGLENAGVKYKNTGILVDKLFATSVKHIYAIGDVRGKSSSTSIAEYEGHLLGNNLANKTKNQVSRSGFTRITKTHPEVAVVGFTEDDLVRRDRKYKKSLVMLANTPIGRIEDVKGGFVKLLADRSNHILGATIVAPNAHLLTEEIAIAIRHNLTTLEIASTPHITNSYNYAIQQASKELINKKK